MSSRVDSPLLRDTDSIRMSLARTISHPTVSLEIFEGVEPFLRSLGDLKPCESIMTFYPALTVLETTYQLLYPMVNFDLSVSTLRYTHGLGLILFRIINQTNAQKRFSRKVEYRS